MKKIIFVIIAILISMGTSAAFGALKPDEPAPTFSLRDSEGKDFYLSDVVGTKIKEKVHGVLLSFFASWCVPCRNDLPLINSLVDELKEKGIKVVLVDVKEDFDTIGALLKELKVNKPVVLSDQYGTVAEKYGVRFLPATFFIGADGKIKDIIFGEIQSEKELRDSASKLAK